MNAVEFIAAGTPRVVSGAQGVPDEIVEAELLGTADFELRDPPPLVLRFAI